MSAYAPRGRPRRVKEDLLEPTDQRHARYALGVLIVVYVLNFLDRQILSILAERIKADLGVSDAQMGYLYGTAFAVFYAVFGIPLGRLADVWDRRLLISWGLAAWSAMTAASGLARSFVHLALARFGVGVGEASASPAAYSMLSDYYPPARRATALALYSSGIYIGSGLGLGLGGLIVDRWDAAWAGAPPFGLRGWQVAFFAVGLPGILLALWVARLREPVRGQADGIVTAPEPHPFRQFFYELRAVLPPLTILHLALSRAGARAVAWNLAAAAGLGALATLLTRALGNPAQWISLGVGLYAAVSWAQAVAQRDPASFALIFRTPSLHFSNLGFAFLAFTSYGVGFWMAPFFVRLHRLDEGRVGLIVGGTAALGGWLGVTAGGLLADRWRRTTPRARLYVGMVTAVTAAPLALLVLWTPSRALALALTLPMFAAKAMWLGPAIATVQDLVLPRMRALASAAFLLVITLIGLALGPYTIGRLSVAAGDLRTGMSLALLSGIVAIVLLALAARTLVGDESSRRDRARAAGEAI